MRFVTRTAVRAGAPRFSQVVRHAGSTSYPGLEEHARRATCNSEDPREAQHPVPSDVSSRGPEGDTRDLVHDPDAASLLGKYKETPCGRARVASSRRRVARVAPLDTEDIARHASEWRRNKDVALARRRSLLDKRHVPLAREPGMTERVDPEVPVAGREPRLASRRMLIAELPSKRDMARRSDGSGLYKMQVGASHTVRSDEPRGPRSVRQMGRDQRRRRPNRGRGLQGEQPRPVRSK